MYSIAYMNDSMHRTQIYRMHLLTCPMSIFPSFSILFPSRNSTKQLRKKKKKTHNSQPKKPTKKASICICIQNFQVFWKADLKASLLQWLLGIAMVRHQLLTVESDQRNPINELLGTKVDGCSNIFSLNQWRLIAKPKGLHNWKTYAVFIQKHTHTDDTHSKVGSWWIWGGG